MICPIDLAKAVGFALVRTHVKGRGYAWGVRAAWLGREASLTSDTWLGAYHMAMQNRPRYWKGRHGI